MVDKFNKESRPVILIGAVFALTLVGSCSIFEYPPSVFIGAYAIGMGVFKGLL
jgi:hypothetical protein